MTISLAKVSQLLGKFLGFLQNIIFKQKRTVATLWATFGKIGLLFIPVSGHTGKFIVVAKVKNNTFSRKKYALNGLLFS